VKAIVAVDARYFASQIHCMVGISLEEVHTVFKCDLKQERIAADGFLIC